LRNLGRTLHVFCAKESEREWEGIKDWYAQEIDARIAPRGRSAGGGWRPTRSPPAQRGSGMKRSLSMQFRPVHEVLLTRASPCRLDETVISSLFINLVSCHQNYRCVSLLIVYVTSTETGLTRFDLPAQSLTILLFHDPSVTRALIAVGIRN
jgi:hypothetical protein